jgi:hypothetical protein
MPVKSFAAGERKLAGPEKVRHLKQVRDEAPGCLGQINLEDDS